MKSTTTIAILIIIVLLGGGYYWYTTQQPAPAGETSLAGSPEANNNDADTSGASTATPTLSVASTAALGQFLTAANGMTLYLYTKDTPGTSNCSGQCAVNWPPYTVSSVADLAVNAVAGGALGTTARADGSLQVTYKGVPLYFYIKDTKPGDTTGQDVGGVWYVVKP